MLQYNDTINLFKKILEYKSCKVQTTELSITDWILIESQLHSAIHLARGVNVMWKNKNRPNFCGEKDGAGLKEPVN